MFPLLSEIGDSVSKTDLLLFFLIVVLSLNRSCLGLPVIANLSISRFEYVKKIIELFDIDSEVQEAKDGMFKRVAPVSKNESAINYKLNLLNLNVMRKWEDSLSEYIIQLKDEI